MTASAKKLSENELPPQLPATTSTAGPPAALMGAMEADAGKGVSGAQEDNIVPLISVLDAKSPQVNKSDGDYIKGAEQGDFWFHNSPTPIINGQKGFLFQPCFFSKDWIEWVPRDKGGGFVTRYLTRPAEAKAIADSRNSNIVKYFMPNGNEVKETRNHMGYAVLDDGTAMAYALPLTSTGHTSSREWMGLMNRQRYGSVKPPSWSVLYRLTTRYRQNEKGNWYVLSASNAGPEGTPHWVTPEEYARGKALYEAFASGSKQVADEVSESSADDSKIPF